jgi:hypothetical protein
VDHAPVGLAVLDRLLARGRRERELLAFGLACGASFAAWLAAPTLLELAFLVRALLPGLRHEQVRVVPAAEVKDDARRRTRHVAEREEAE